ncbi:undecaprenyl-diphosphate phosphatase [Marinospirillum sp.]|uniref:undecaprenyl-diphosphate phosphatase n=1 Tax=Marinospirillum sp. TaxID=2183934 RepID=UPI0028705DF3|nr:undecaprenyl-diphosphate phosphatase [Marinospirillum sp.]MDR9466938.1 undecaprenyl-diphosphate phosphatase [Marinospirillum sp.]
MDWLQLIVLSLVQGLTEFLPISSSAHLILVPVVTSWTDQGLAFDVALHVGTLSAVILYFRHDLVRMTLGWGRSLQTRQLNEDARLAWAIIFATIPVGLAGITLNSWIATELRSPVVMAFSLIGFGLLLAYADWGNKGVRTENQMTWKDVLFIALAQALALIPGTSRSGITITAALLMGLSREAAARFSFLLSIPVITLAGMLEILGLVESDHPVDWQALFWGALFSGISAYLCIHYFLVFIQRLGMQPFVAYRVLLGILLLYFFW